MTPIHSVLERLGSRLHAAHTAVVRATAWRPRLAAARRSAGAGAGAALVVVAATAVACGAAGLAAAQQNELVPHFTVAEVMEAVVMPAADVVWNAPQFPEEGDEIVGPATDEGWLAARHAAVALAESANLLIVPGRKAHAADKEVGEGELSAAEIEALIVTSRGAWIAYARAMQAAALEALTAIDARDAEKLLDAGGTLDSSCQGCHKQFWYPNQ